MLCLRRCETRSQLPSFSTHNATLNTSLRLSIGMRDFFKLHNSMDNNSFSHHYFTANNPLPSPPLLFLSFMVLCFIYFILFIYLFILFLFCFLFFSRFSLSALIRIGTTKSALLDPFFKYLVFDSKIVNKNLPSSRPQTGVLLHPFFKHLVFDSKIIN